MKEIIQKEKSGSEGERTMAVSAGVLYEVRGEAARRMMQELEYPTKQQLEKRQEIRDMIKECTNFITFKVKK